MKRSRVLSVEEKSGRSGPLTFARVGHTVEQDGETCVDEVQHVVYRGAGHVAARTGRGGGEHPREAPGGWSVTIDPTVLFRFSALTRNAHRIHYDADYARDVEGYRGLVVHGPLQAMLMAETARRGGLGGKTGIEYRLVAPLHVHDGLHAEVVTTSEGSRETAIRSTAGHPTATGTVRVLQG